MSHISCFFTPVTFSHTCHLLSNFSCLVALVLFCHTCHILLFCHILSHLLHFIMFSHVCYILSHFVTFVMLCHICNFFVLVMFCHICHTCHVCDTGHNCNVCHTCDNCHICHVLSHFITFVTIVIFAIWKTTTKKPRTSLNFLDWVHVFRDQTCRNRKISWFKFNLVLAKFLAHVCFFIWKNVTNGFPAKGNISRHITWWYKPTHCI